MAFCPNINSKEVREKFNSVVKLFGGKPLTIEEFKNVDLRDKRIGIDKLAMDIAYKIWDITKGENIPNNKNEIINIIKSTDRNIISDQQRKEPNYEDDTLSNLQHLEEQNVHIEINNDLLSIVDPILKELNDNGKNTVIVGGAVRDALLGIKPKDIDIEVYNTSLEELEKFLSKYGKVDLVGKSFGIIKFKPYDSYATILEDEIPNSGLLLTIGISGSGKSTYINSIPNDNKVVISPDDIRIELTGDVNNQTRNKEVFDIAISRAKNALKEGKLVIFDATNTNTKLRNNLVARIFEDGDYQLYYKLFDSTPQESYERIQKQLNQINKEQYNLEDLKYLEKETVSQDKQYDLLEGFNELLQEKLKDKVVFVDNIEEVYSDVRLQINHDDIYESLSLMGKYGIEDHMLVEFFKHHNLGVPADKVKSKEQFYELALNAVQKLIDIEKLMAVIPSEEKMQKEYEAQAEISKREYGYVREEVKLLLKKEYWEKLIEEINKKRRETLNEWIDFITKEHPVYSKDPGFQYLVWKALSKEYRLEKNTYSAQPPVLYKNIVNNIYEKLKNKEIEPFSSVFAKSYDDLAVEYVIKNSEIVKVKGKNIKDGVWITIPSYENDPENYKQNAKRLQALSYKTWCTKSGTAEFYLKNGNFYIYIEKDDNITEQFLASGKDISEVGIENVKIGIGYREKGKVEIQGQANNGKVPLEYYDQIKEFVEKKNLKVIDNRLEKARQEKEMVEYYRNFIKQLRNQEENVKLYEKLVLEKDDLINFLNKTGSKYHINEEGKIVVDILFVQDNRQYIFKDIVEVNKIEYVDTLYLAKKYEDILYKVDEMSDVELLEYIKNKEKEEKKEKKYFYSPNEKLYFPDLEVAFNFEVKNVDKNIHRYDKLRIVKNKLDTDLDLPNLFIAKDFYNVGEAPKLTIVANSCGKNPDSLKYVLFKQDNKKGFANKAIVGEFLKRDNNNNNEILDLLVDIELRYFDIENAIEFYKNFDPSKINDEDYIHGIKLIEKVINIFSDIYNLINENTPEIIKNNWRYKNLINYTSTISFPKGIENLKNVEYLYKVKFHAGLYEEQDFIFIKPENDDNDNVLLRNEEQEIQAVHHGNINNEEDLPFSKHKNFNIEGFYDKANNKVYINADLPKGRLQEVLLHEVIGHMGLEALLSDVEYQEYKNILFGARKYLYEEAKNILQGSGYKSIKELAEDYGYNLNTEEGELKLIKELLARVAETNPSLTWFQRLIGKLQIFFAKVFGIQMSKEGVIELLLLSKDKLNNPNLRLNEELEKAVKTKDTIIKNTKQRSNTPYEILQKQYNDYINSKEIIRNSQQLTEPFDFSVPRRENKIDSKKLVEKTKREISSSLIEATENIIKSAAKRKGINLKEFEKNIKIESTERIGTEDLRKIFNQIYDFEDFNETVEEIYYQSTDSLSEYTVQNKYIKNLGLDKNDYWLSKLLDNEQRFLVNVKRIVVDGVKLSLKESILHEIKNEYNRITNNIENSEYIVSEITDSYLDFLANVAKNNNDIKLYNKINGSERETIRKLVLKEKRDEQINGIKEWINTLNSGNYPIEFKYYILKEVLTKNKKQLDNNNIGFINRTKTTVRPFQSIFKDALDLAFNYERKKYSPFTSYVIILNEFSSKKLPIENKYKEVERGIWFKFSNGDGYKLSNFVQDTNWCTSNIHDAIEQLEEGDFYVFYPYSSSDEKIAIRMKKDNIAEIRGTQKGQDFKNSSIDIIEDFIYTELPSNKKTLFKIKYLKERKKFKNSKSVKKFNKKYIEKLIKLSKYNDAYSDDFTQLIKLISEKIDNDTKVIDYVEYNDNYYIVFDKNGNRTINTFLNVNGIFNDKNKNIIKNLIDKNKTSKKVNVIAIIDKYSESVFIKNYKFYFKLTNESGLQFTFDFNNKDVFNNLFNKVLKEYIINDGEIYLHARKINNNEEEEEEKIADNIYNFIDSITNNELIDKIIDYIDKKRYINITFKNYNNEILTNVHDNYIDFISGLSSNLLHKYNIVPDTVSKFNIVDILNKKLDIELVKSIFELSFEKNNSAGFVIKDAIAFNNKENIDYLNSIFELMFNIANKFKNKNELNFSVYIDNAADIINIINNFNTKNSPVVINIIDKYYNSMPKLPLLKNGRMNFITIYNGNEYYVDVTFEDYKIVKEEIEVESTFYTYDEDTGEYTSYYQTKILVTDKETIYNLYKEIFDINEKSELYKDTYEQSINNEIKGQFIKLANEKALILLHKNADITTVLHELTHLWENYLTDEEKNVVLKWANHDTWTKETSEKFAKGFEQYVYEGVKTGIKIIDDLFEKFARWLHILIKNFKDYFGISELNDEIKQIYNKMLSEGIGLNEKLSEEFKINIEELYKDYLQGNLDIYNKASVSVNSHKSFDVEFDPSITIKEAASRRDFTINSLGYNPISNVLYDYYGGVRDLQEGVIRHTSEKFVEDPLRIFRAMQFQSRLNFDIADETYELMNNMLKGEYSKDFSHLKSNEEYNKWLKRKQELSELSKKGLITKEMLNEYEEVMNKMPKERIAEEFLKWAEKGNNPEKIFEFLEKSGVGDLLFPEFLKLKNIEQDIKHHPEGNVEEHTKQVVNEILKIAKEEKLNKEEKAILVFAGILHDIGKIYNTQKIYSEKEQREVITSYGHEAKSAEIAKDILERIGIKKELIDKIIPIIREHMFHAVIGNISEEKSRISALNKVIKKIQPSSIDNLLRLIKADTLGRRSKEDVESNKAKEIPKSVEILKDTINAFIEKYSNISTPILTGKDLIKIGFKGGVELGNVLKKAQEAQDNLEFSDKKSAYQWLYNYLTTNNVNIKNIDIIISNLENEYKKEFGEGIYNKDEQHYEPDFEIDEELEAQIELENTIKDLASKISDKTGIKILYVKKKEDFKSVSLLSENTVILNLNNLSFDTTILELFSYPVISAIKDKNPLLYENLKKELNSEQGKIILERIKNDYKYYSIVNSLLSEKKITKEKYDLKNEEIEIRALSELLTSITKEEYQNILNNNFLSLLKELLKKVKEFIKELLGKREVKIEELPDNLTLKDLSYLLNYGRGKLLLPGYVALYKTPDGGIFNTYAEAENHLKQLADIAIKNKNIEIDLEKIPESFDSILGRYYKKDNKYYVEDEGKIKEIKQEEYIQTFFDNLKYFKLQKAEKFIEKNKQFELSRLAVEEWKKKNNVKYNAQEAYDYGEIYIHKLSAFAGGLSNENLLLNYLVMLDDIERVEGAEVILSCITRKPNEKAVFETKNNDVRIVVYPKDEDILWAGTTDIFSGTLSDTTRYFPYDMYGNYIEIDKSLSGVSQTKYPDPKFLIFIKDSIKDVIVNKASYNELGIRLNNGNFRFEYDKNVPNKIKKIVDDLNKKLDEKYGEITKPELGNKNRFLDKTEDVDNTELYEIYEDIRRKYDSGQEEILTQTELNIKIAEERRKPKIYSRAFINTEVIPSLKFNITNRKLFENKEIVEKDIDELLGNKKSTEVFEPDYYGLNDNGEVVHYNVSNTLQQLEFDNKTISALISFSEAMIKDLENRIHKIRNKLKVVRNVQEKQQLLSEYQKIDKILKNEKNNLKNLMERETFDTEKQKALIISYAENNLNLIDELLKDPIKNRSIIESIINYFISLGTFDINKKNPIFIDNTENNEFINKINKNKLDEYEKELYSLLTNYKEKFYTKYNELQIKYNENIDNELKDYNVKLEHLLNPKKDISLWDLFMNNVATNTFSDDSLIGEILMEKVRESFVYERAKINELLTRLDDLQIKVEEKLKKSGKNISHHDINNIFYQKDELGLKTGRIISPFSIKWFRDLAEAYSKTKNGKEIDVKERRRKIINFIKESADVLKIHLLPEIYDTYSGSIYDNYLNNSTEEERKEYKNKLVKLIGNEAYNMLIEETIRNIEEYEAWKISFTERYNNSQTKDENEYNFMLEHKNPFANAIKWNDNSVNKNKLSLDYLTIIPKTKKEIINEYGDVEYVDSKYYDDNFNSIKNDDVFEKYWKTLIEASEIINIAFADTQDSVRINSIPTFKKTFGELFYENRIKGGIFKAFMFSIRYFIDLIKTSLRISTDKTLLSVDVKDIEKGYEDTFNAKVEEVNNLYVAEWISINNGKNIKIIDVNNLNQQQIAFLAEKLNIKPSKEEFRKKLGEHINVSNLLIRAASNFVTLENSQDISKIFRMALTLAAEYNARKNVEDFVAIMKERYEKIQRIKDNEKLGSKNKIENYVDKELQTDKLSNLRNRAIKRMNFFYDKAIKNADDKVVYGVFKGILGNKNLNKERTYGIINFLRTGKIYTKEEKEFMKKTDEIRKKIYDNLSDDIKKVLSIDDITFDNLKEIGINITDDLRSIAVINEKRKQIGANFALSSFINSVLTFIRFKALAYNFSAGINNRIEGVFSNMIADSSGKFWTPGNAQIAELFVNKYYLARLNKNSNISKQWEIFKSLLFELNVIEDASNELQRSSIKTDLKNIGKLSPYYLSVSSVELRNQGVTALSILMDIDITDKYGNKHKVFENNKFVAFEVVNGKIKLKEEFRTQENIDMWERQNSKDFFKLRNKITKTINTLHGDYENIGGFYLKSSDLGRAIGLFKTWLPAQIWLRFAKEQETLHGKVKGRYYSLTPVSGTTLGALAFSWLGPIGIGIGSGIGLTWSLINGIKTDVSIIKELIVISKNILKKTLFLPFNIVGLFRKQGIINIDTLNLSETDKANLRANITDISLMLGLLLLKIIISAIRGWDDDEDEKPIKPSKIEFQSEEEYNKALADYKHKMKIYEINKKENSWYKDAFYNIVENKISNFINNISAYANVKTIYEDYTQHGLYRLLDDLYKFIGALEEGLEGDGKFSNGIYKGQNKIYVRFKNLFMPAFVKGFGFETIAERDFTKEDAWEDLTNKSYYEKLKEKENKINKIIEEGNIPYWVEKQKQEKLDKLEIQLQKAIAKNNVKRVKYLQEQIDKLKNEDYK